jgi:hypothetical protein
MHPEFEEKRSKPLFNKLKYFKQWFALIGLFSAFFVFNGNHSALLVTSFLGSFIFLSYHFALPLFRGATLFWLKIGGYIGKIMQPIIMGVVFGLIFTPFALLFRLVSAKNKTGFQKVKLSFSKEDFNQQF